MAVVIDVVRGGKTLGQISAEHGTGPSSTAGRRDELPGGAGDAFGETRQDREGKESEGVARERCDEALRKIGRPAVERDFLRRFCDDNACDPEGAHRGRRASRGAVPREGVRAAGGGPHHHLLRQGAPRDGRRR